jgi:hypothetical protein
MMLPGLRIVEVAVVPGGVGLALTDVGEIRTGAHGPEHHGPVVDVIAADRAAATPAPFQVGAIALGADLLGVAIDTAQGAVMLGALLGLTRPGHRIDDRGVGIGVLGQGAHLAVRHEHQTHPTGGQGEEDSQEE